MNTQKEEALFIFLFLFSYVTILLKKENEIMNNTIDKVRIILVGDSGMSSLQTCG